MFFVFSAVSKAVVPSSQDCIALVSSDIAAVISAIPQEQMVLPYPCTVSSSAITLILGSWYRPGEGLKVDKQVLFYSNRPVCVH